MTRWWQKITFTRMGKRELTAKQQKTTAIVALSIAAVTMLLVIIFVGIPMVRFISVPERFREWVDQRGIWGKVAFVAMEILKVICVFLPGEPFELASGYAFGIWEGTLLCTIGISIGSIIVFLLVKTFGASIVSVFFKPEKLDSLRHVLKDKKKLALFIFIYIIPGTPKDFLNYCAGLTEIRFTTWLIVCSIGRFPSIITSTIAGDAIEQKNYVFGILVFVATFLLGLVGLFIYNRVIANKGDKEV